MKRLTRYPITIRTDLWELTLVLLSLGVVTWLLGVDHHPVQSSRELAVFRQRYGPEHNTKREEEWLIRDHFQDRRGGSFVEVGANHYRVGSKTYYLETELGWSGLAVEPQAGIRSGLHPLPATNEIPAVLRFRYVEQHGAPLCHASRGSIGWGGPGRT